MNISNHTPKNIDRVARSVGHALALGTDSQGWLGLALIFKTRLTPQERAALAFSALNSLEPDDAARVFEAACPSANYPPPTLDNAMSDARWWSGLANATELKAYAVAAYEAMAPDDKAAFLLWASDKGRVAA